jgi:hypothetical protein
MIQEFSTGGDPFSEAFSYGINYKQNSYLRRAFQLKDMLNRKGTRQQQ